jgi:hypothetical protein
MAEYQIMDVVKMYGTMARLDMEVRMHTAPSHVRDMIQWLSDRGFTWFDVVYDEDNDLCVVFDCINSCWLIVRAPGVYERVMVDGDVR